MKKIAVFCVFILLCNACSMPENYTPYTYSNEGDIYSTSEKVKFRELLFTLKPYTMVDAKKKYIVSDSIKNIVIKINEKSWAVINSFAIDTSQIARKESSTTWIQSEQPISYAVVAPFQNAKTTLTTAGEYAALLSNFFILENGSYFCRIESFDIRQKNGTMKTIKPYLVALVEVKDNLRNAWLGELEVLIPAK